MPVVILTAVSAEAGTAAVLGEMASVLVSEAPSRQHKLAVACPPPLILYISDQFRFLYFKWYIPIWYIGLDSERSWHSKPIYEIVISSLVGDFDFSSKMCVEY